MGALPSREATFECLRCGACCRVSGYVRVTDRDVAALAAVRGLSIPAVTDRYTRLLPDRSALALKNGPDGECIFLGEQGCAVHSAKPAQCRGYPTEWRFSGTESVCKGLQGKTNEA